MAQEKTKSSTGTPGNLSKRRSARTKEVMVEKRTRHVRAQDHEAMDLVANISHGLASGAGTGNTGNAIARRAMERKDDNRNNPRHIRVK